MESKKVKLTTKFMNVIIYLLFSCVLLLFTVGYMIFNTINEQEKELFTILEDSDLRYLREVIGRGHYHIKGGCLFVGDTCLGDGTKEKANQNLFKNYTKRTGAHCYVYMRCPDEGLGWKEDITQIEGGYFEGHYICVCDSVKDVNSKYSYVGWKLAKEDAEQIDKEGVISFLDDYILNGKIIKQISRAQVIKDSVTNENIAVVAVSRSVNDRKLGIERISINFAFLVLLIVVVIGGGLIFIVSKHTYEIRKTIDYISKIDKEDFPKEPLSLESKGPMRDVEQAVNRMVESLKYNKRVSEELELARVIQNKMIPRNFEKYKDFKEFSIYADMVTAKEVGGDFYDFFMVDDNHLVFTIADVSGKGVPAAMLMAVSRMLIKNFVLLGMDISEAFSKTNTLICNDNETNMFITAWIGLLDLKTGLLKCCNAGHNPPLLFHDGKLDYFKSKRNLVLGVMEDYEYKNFEFELKAGDKLLIYTDGVTECKNDKSEFFGEPNFKDFVNENIDKKPKELIESIYDKLKSFANGAEQSDDITILCIDYFK